MFSERLYDKRDRICRAKDICTNFILYGSDRGIHAERLGEDTDGFGCDFTSSEPVIPLSDASTWTHTHQMVARAVVTLSVSASARAPLVRSWIPLRLVCERPEDTFIHRYKEGVVPDLSHSVVHFKRICNRTYTVVTNHFVMGEPEE